MNKEQVSTLYPALIKKGKAKGNTTRILNNAIELLFEGKEIIVKDHYDNGNNYRANEILARKILEKLKNDFDIPYRFLDVDDVEFTIKIKSRYFKIYTEHE